MAIYNDHQGITIDEFNGLWQRGDIENTPLDHFSDGENFKFVGNKAFGTRDGIGISQDVVTPISNIKRVYNYPTQTGNTLLVLAIDTSNSHGKIYHVVDATTVFGPILDINGMTDFAFVPFAGRAYISPFTSYTITSLSGTLNIEKGLQNEFVYVYLGAGVAAHKTAGAGLAGGLTAALGAAGTTDTGLHIFGVVSETDTGYLSPPAAFTTLTLDGTHKINFSTIPVSGDTNVVKRHIVASKAINNYNGDPTGYDLFFIPGADLNDNTTLVLNGVSFFDADLLDDASHLLDNYSSIPAGAVLSIYHNRMVVAATFTDVSLMLVSAEGEPEAISQIDGLVVFPLDGNPITNVQEYRDVMYSFKRSRTVSYIDNGDVPASWPLVSIDNSLGTCVHGIGTVLDSGSSAVEFLTVCTYQGIVLFNGRYIIPELTWKIENLWKSLDRNEFRKIQIVISPTFKEIYTILPTRKLLVGNYSNGMTPKAIRWAVWSFIMGVNTVAIANIDQLIFGADIPS